MKKIAVLIPCYNESVTIEKVIRDYKKALPEADIYVYDNNSSDKTDEIARAAGAIVKYEYRQGKGNVIRSMFRDIEADCYLMIDGDDTYPAEHARKMVELVLEKGVDMVIGDRLSSTYLMGILRYLPNTKLYKNKIIDINKDMDIDRDDFINKLFDNEICDIMTGYRAFSRKFVKTFPVLSKGFEIETEMTIHAVDKNFLLEEIPVKYRDRPDGSVSKLNTFSDGMKVLSTIATLFREYRPFAFFTSVSILLEVIALVFFIPVLLEFFRTGLVLKFPTLIVSGIIAMIGILLWVCGIILEVIVKKHRQLYEILLNQIEMMDPNEK